MKTKWLSVEKAFPHTGDCVVIGIPDTDPIEGIQVTLRDDGSSPRYFESHWGKRFSVNDVRWWCPDTSLL